ncbi:MAG: CBS domain-containing protein [Myxococcales bacterium]|nr:CBS domain-containing protein [Myxococcales bacterium]
MTREVVTLHPADDLTGVEEGMRRLRFRHLPVVEGDKLVGLVTQRDLLRIAASSLEPGAPEKTRALVARHLVRDVMQQELVTVREDTPLAEAGELLWDHKLGCLPVVRADGGLVGIVTEADFVRLALDLLAAR